MEAIKCDFFRQLLTVFAKCRCFSETDVLVPFHKADTAKSIFHRHIQSVVIQPVRIFRKEFLIVSGLCKALFPGIVKRNFQNFKTGQINLLIVHIMLIVSEIIAVTDLFCQIAVFDQKLHVNIVGIPRKGGKGLVRRIAVASRT